MESKFEKISEFIDGLEESNVIDEKEQAFLLVGGSGSGTATNERCVNTTSCKDSINPGCTNIAGC